MLYHLPWKSWNMSDIDTDTCVKEPQSYITTNQFSKIHEKHINTEKFAYF
jgi:hypothetical protein